VIHPAGSPVGGDAAVPSGILGKVQIFPTLAPVRPRVTVENTTDTAVTWRLGEPQDGLAGGALRPDGTWLTPGWTYASDFLVLQATSHADPLQFAKLRTFVAELDADMDTETDAFDLGTVAMARHVVDSPRPAANVSKTSSVLDDWDLVWFAEAMHNAWPARR
jgi:hypothetical protein